MNQGQYNFREVTQKAIDKCIENTDRRHPGWSDRCYKLLKRYTRNKKKSFMCEDFRAYCEGKIEMPDSLRAFGGVIGKAAYWGLIKKKGLDHVKTASSHMANAGVWVATGKQ